jgi:hypothetical protein
MTNSIRNWVMALLCVAFGLVYAVAGDTGTPMSLQDAAASGSIDNSKHSPVATLTEYACKKGTQHKGTRAGLVSEVMQRGADNQPVRVLGVKDSKTGEVEFIYVLDSDCSGEQPVGAPGANLALAHKASGGDEYFYAISGQAECLRAFQIRFLGQFVPVDISTKAQDCQNEMRIWSGLAAKWKTQANSSGNAKP